MRNRWRVVILGLFLSIAMFAQAQSNPAKPADEVWAIRAGTLVDGRSEQPLRDKAIIIRGNRIEAVIDADVLASRNIAHVVNFAASVTVMPGMIESHTHIFLQGEDPAKGGYDVNILKYPLAYRAARATVSARRLLEQGFTTTRDMETEGAGYGDIGIRDAINDGWIPGPRLFVVTKALSTTGGYPLEGFAPELDLPKGAQLADGPVEFRKATREQLGNGADWIKVYMTHRSWVDRDGHLQSQPTLTLDEIKAVVDEAHGWGKKVACHAYNGIGMRRALDGGCDSIEHGLELTDADIAQMVRQGTWYCATLTPYYYWNAPPDTPEGKRDRARVAVHGPSFQKALKAGVKIVFGTDAGSFEWTDPNSPIAAEFARMVEFGMTPMQAIRSATSMPAVMLDMEGQIGVVAPGAFADIIAVQGDPLRDVNVLKNVGFVVKDGKVFKNELR
ncbi:MAG TPA: amidohydrolase family protein [Terriglobales bacterium]